MRAVPKGEWIRAVVLVVAMALGLLALAGLARGAGTSAVTDGPVRIGVLAYRGAAHAQSHWGPLADYLDERLAPRRFEIVPLAYAELTRAVQAREVQLLITNTGHYTELEMTAGVSRIATRLMTGPNGPLDSFGGVVITRAANARLNRYADLRGLRLMVPDKSSLGGWQVHVREALEQGLNLERDTRQIIETRNHEKVVEGVLAGQADAGFVRSDLVESMAGEGRIRLADLHIVNLHPVAGYPFLLSTRLYPEWPLARVAGVPDALAKDVLIALLAMPPSHPAARAAGIQGWTLPMNYQSVQDLFREARLGPFADLPIRFADVLARYGEVLAAMVGLVFSILAAVVWYVSRVNRSLKREIRRRVEAEHGLEESDRKFRDLSDTLPSLIWIADTDKRCTHFNRAWLEFTGRTLAQEFGDGWAQGVHPDDLERCMNTFVEAFDARRPFEMRYRLRHASGEYRWIVDVGTPRYAADGSFRGYFGHCMDITEIQRLSDALSESRERYMLAQRAAHIASLDWNLASDHLEWSDEAAGLLGWSADAPPTTFPAFLAHVHAADRAAVAQAFQEAREQGAHYSVEHRIVLPGGELRWVAETGDVFRDARERAVRMVGILQDITARRLAEEALRQSNTQLAASLAVLKIHNQDLTHINEMNEVLQSCVREEEIHQVFGHMAETLGLGSGGMLAVARLPGDALESVCAWGDAGGMVAQFPPNDCWGIRRGQIYEPGTTQPGLLCAHLPGDEPGHSLCLPLAVQSEVLGLIVIRAPAGTDESAWLRVRQLGATLGEALKLALSNFRLREALREQATRDPLTGLFNRRYLDETLPREIHANLRDHQPLALAILDLDNFKHYNDTWGHEAGDQVLIQVARILGENLRASDIACRFGGEELVAVMPGAELDEARSRIQAIANLLRQVEVRVDNRPLPTVTFSAGIAVTPRHADHADALLRAADQALYAAKQAGRDRILGVGETG